VGVCVCVCVLYHIPISLVHDTGRTRIKEKKLQRGSFILSDPLNASLFPAPSEATPRRVNVSFINPALNVINHLEIQVRQGFFGST